VAEGARLESVFTRKGNVGSNPTLSASFLSTTYEHRSFSACNGVQRAYNVAWLFRSCPGSLSKSSSKLRYSGTPANTATRMQFTPGSLL
jgi:hypothetical protein